LAGDETALYGNIQTHIAIYTSFTGIVHTLIDIGGHLVKTPEFPLRLVRY
jgi:hypothetical protein